MPGAVKSGESTLFTRTMRVERTKEPLTFILADDGGNSAALVNGPAGAKIENIDRQLRLILPVMEKTAVFNVVIGAAGEGAKSLPPPVGDHGGLVKGGPARGE